MVESTISEPATAYQAPSRRLVPMSASERPELGWVFPASSREGHGRRSTWGSICFATLLGAVCFGQSPSQPPTFTVNVERILVPVVVRDGYGRIVEDLRADDFRIVDNKKPRSISGFSLVRRGAEGEKESAPTPLLQRPETSSSVVPNSSSQNRFIVLLFDDFHMSREQLVRVQEASLEMLHASLEGASEAAVLTTSGQINSGFTRDPAKLESAIKSVQIHEVFRSEGPGAMGDDSAAVQAKSKEIMESNPGLNRATDQRIADGMAQSSIRQAKNLQDQAIQVTFDCIDKLIQQMAGLPGERTLVLLSPGFPTNWPEARMRKSRAIDLALRSEVAINSLDVRGLWTPFSSGASAANEDVMAELAHGTGGNFFHNNNDVKEGAKALLEVPECVYILELSLDDVKKDGAFHRLNVTVNRPGLDVSARPGYIVQKREKNSD